MVPIINIKDFCDFAYFCTHNSESKILDELNKLKNEK